MHKIGIIGGGPGGYMAAIRASRLGLEPIIFEKAENLGGTCLNRGCIPTKVLVETANRFQELNRCGDFGINCGGDASIDWNGVQARKASVVKKLSQGLSNLMKSNNISVERGEAKLLDAHTVRCQDKEFQFENIVLATGSEISVPAIFPVDGERVITSDHILDIAEIPESLIVVGSGAVGMEFASLFARLGSQVTVIEALERVLPLEDEEVSAEIQRLSRKIGVRIYTKCSIERVVREEDSVLAEGSGLPEEGLRASKLLVAVGRRANISGLGLEELGATVERGKVVVNANMQTSIPNIYAIGDIVATPQLAHVAEAEGLLAVEHIAGLAPEPIDYGAYPSATYCWPEVASVGLSEAKAIAEGFEIKKGKFPLVALGKANIVGATDGFVKVIADSRDDRVLGVHMVGPHATDMIAEAVVAVRNKLTLGQLAHSIHPHPTLSESIAEAVHGALGSPLSYVPIARRSRR